MTQNLPLCGTRRTSTSCRSRASCWRSQPCSRVGQAGRAPQGCRAGRCPPPPPHLRGDSVPSLSTSRRL
eukprot:4217488-Alexandrium_andersonii.AAC.1